MTRRWNVLVLLLATVVALLGRTAVSAATATDLPEKVVTDISTLAGIWKGTVAGGAAMELTINPDGTWTNVLTGGGTFTGTAMVAGGKVRARSDTTGRAYFWKLLERGGRRVLIFLNDPDETVAATVDFDSRSASGTAPKNSPVVAPKSAPRTSEVAIAGCISQTVIRVQGPESVSIPGVLYCPTRVGVAPGVVLLPPTGGVRKHVLDWGEWLASEGYVALVLDSDAARRTVTPFRTRMQDAFAAATRLHALGLADTGQIAVVGFSIGGSAALAAAGESAATGGAGYRFRAAIAFYTPCVSLREDTTIPVLLLLGNKDAITPPTGCVTDAQRLKDAGKDISLTLYPDAHHGFDIVEAGAGMSTPWGHIRYDADATSDARLRVASFLARTLRKSP